MPLLASLTFCSHMPNAFHPLFIGDKSKYLLFSISSYVLFQGPLAPAGPLHRVFKVYSRACFQLTTFAPLRYLLSLSLPVLIFTSLICTASWPYLWPLRYPQKTTQWFSIVVYRNSFLRQSTREESKGGGLSADKGLKQRKLGYVK